MIYKVRYPHARTSRGAYAGRNDAGDRIWTIHCSCGWSGVGDLEERDWMWIAHYAQVQARRGRSPES